MPEEQMVRELERALESLTAVSDADVKKKIDVINDLAWALADSDMKRAYALAEEARAMSSSSNENDDGYDAGLAYSLRTMGYLKMRFGDFAPGLKLLFEAREICESLSLQDGLIDTLDGIAGTYLHIGEYSQSLDTIFKELELARQIGDRRRIINANNNLGAVYYETGDRHKTREILEENLDQALEINYRRQICLAYLNLSESHVDEGNYEQALHFGLRGVQAAHEWQYELFEAYGHNFLGKLYRETGRAEESIAYFEKALALSREAESQPIEAVVLLDMAKAYNALNQDERTFACAELCVKIAEAIQAYPEASAAHLLLSGVYEENADAARALAHYQAYHAAREQLLTEQADLRLQVLKVIHDTESAEKEAEIARLRNVELQGEIEERARIQTLLERQLEYVHALSAFSQTLLVPTSGEESYRRLLAEALQHLIQPTASSAIHLFQLVDDEHLGRCLRLFSSAHAAENLGRTDDLRSFFKFSQRLYRPTPADPSGSTGERGELIPISIVPADLRQQLASGSPVGGLSKNLFSEDSDWWNYLLVDENVLSIQVFPIVLETGWWGAIILFDLVQEREWEGDEILLVNAAAEMVKGAVQRWQAEIRLQLLNEELEQKVNQRTVDLRDSVTSLQREIKERKRAEAETQQMVELLEQRVTDRSRELAALYDMTILLNDAGSLAETLEPALVNISASAGAGSIAVHILSADQQVLRLAAQLGLSGDERMREIPLSERLREWLREADAPLMFMAETQASPLIPAALLPPGCAVYFGVTLRVRGRVIGLLSAYREQERPFGFENVSLLITMAEQLSIIIQNHRYQEQAHDMTRLIERQRLARELHDSVAQRIYSLHLFARSGADAARDGDMEEVRLRLRQVETNTLFALREMRLLLYQLRPLALESLSLIAAMEDRFERVERRLGIEAVIVAESEPALDEAEEEELYFIITEALNNALKHAEASRVDLTFAIQDGELEVIVRDNGKGFDSRVQSPGQGLENICMRTDALGGLVVLETAVGQGTTIRIKKTLHEDTAPQTAAG